MLDRAYLKQSALEKLRGRWKSGVILTCLYALIVYGGSMVPGISPLVGIFITPALGFGAAFCYLQLILSDSLETGDLFKGFSFYLKSLGMYWWRMLWIFLWVLLLIVPGLIKSIAYSQAFYIIADNPDVKIRDAMKISMKMTEGHKWELVMLDFSFFGWAFLAILTLGIGFLWLSPYMSATYAATYLKLKEMSIQNGVCSEDMFNGKTRLV